MTKIENQRPKTKIDDVAGIILAAGRSQRMGAFKPLLPFGPKTVIETCIDNMRSGGVQTVIVVISQDTRAEEIKTRLLHADIIFAVNPNPESEMSASIAYAVLNTPKTIKAVIINPVDHAAVPGGVISVLIGEWEKGARLVKPISNHRGGHPVLVDMVFRNQLQQLNPEGGLKAFFRKHQDEVKRVEANSIYVARDMDTWDDYRALHQEVFGVPAPNQSFPDTL
jgi:molybdenum cofactor cytidylyltransferase